MDKIPRWQEIRTKIGVDRDQKNQHNICDNLQNFPEDFEMRFLEITKCQHIIRKGDEIINGNGEKL